MNLNIKGVSVNSKPRSDGRWQGYYTDGKDKQYVYGRTRAEVNEKLYKLVKTGIKKQKHTLNGAPTTFEDFTLFYFENFRARKVVPTTLKGDMSRFNNYLKPAFKNRPIKSITAQECQNLIDRIQRQGKGKTADDVYSLLTVILKMAIKFGIIQRSPCDIVFHQQHERKNGKVLTHEQLKFLLENSGKFQTIYAIAMFTGLRPNEYSKMSVKDGFIVAVNSKRKNGKVEYKKIPVMRELEPYLTEPIEIPSYEVLRKHFKTIFPKHTLKDLRKTFNSRCIECGINEIVRKIWMGHSLGELGRAYTELSDEFYLSEARKFYFFESV